MSVAGAPLPAIMLRILESGGLIGFLRSHRGWGDSRHVARIHPFLAPRFPTALADACFLCVESAEAAARVNRS